MFHRRQWRAIYNDRICLCLGGKISIFRFWIIKKELLSNLLTGTWLLKGTRCLILLQRKYYSFLNDLISLLFENFKDELLLNSRSSSHLRNYDTVVEDHFHPQRHRSELSQLIPQQLAGPLAFCVPMATCHLFSLPRVTSLKLSCPVTGVPVGFWGTLHLGPDHFLRVAVSVRVSVALRRHHDHSDS